MKMNASLFDEIIDSAQDCIFWKDKERRFVGANQSFLDFYGFESVHVLLGKTDEDMGWHNNPEPFRQDELRVLNGESTYKVQGKCMVRGEERDIIATKRPIYGGDGEIVGLVGSFSDVTDVLRRKKEMEHAQIMYSVPQLRKYSYFDKLLDEIRLEEILDPLTGIVSRGYILDFAKALIASKTPFTFTILDLDNFKYINDTYGHHAGDIVLMEISKGLADFSAGFGVAGRFGGDELIFINLRDFGYQEKEDFFEDLYVRKQILRRNLTVEGNELFVTGTSGCATYPHDAVTYEELFALIDKALYQGKNRGRNCFTIYVEEEHGNLEISNIARSGVQVCMQALAEKIERTSGFVNQLKCAMPLLRDELQISNCYYVDKKGQMHSAIDSLVKEDVSDITRFMEDELYFDNTLVQIKNSSPRLYGVLRKMGVCALMIVRIGMKEEIDGYLICTETEGQRIWQEDERGILYFLAKLLSMNLKIEGEIIPE